MRRLLLLALAIISATTCCTHPKALQRPTPEPTPEVQTSTPAPLPTLAPPQPDRVGRITFRDSVTDKSAEGFVTSMTEIYKFGAKRVFIEIHTPGGSVDAGFLMVKAMEEFPGQVVCLIDGEAASEGFFLLQGCDVRLMTRRSLLMIHEPFIEAARLNSGSLSRLGHYQRAVSFAWSEHAAKKLKISAADLRKRIATGDWWLNCDEAMKLGAVDNLVPNVTTTWQAVMLGAPIPVL